MPFTPGSEAIVASAQARGVPIVSSLQMLQWLDGRNASSFQNLTWSGTTLTFAIDVGAGANGLQALLPASSGAGPLTGISRGGVPISYTLQTLKGIEYAVFTATAGAYEATYALQPAISTSSATVDEISGSPAWANVGP